METTGSTDGATTPSRPLGQFLDEKELINNAGFPIRPDALIERCKEILASNNLTEEIVDVENFTFSAPIVGPINFTQYKEALASFDLLTGFPDLKFCFHHFRVDPCNPARVWYTSRAYGTNTGVLAGQPPTGKVIDMPPEAGSMTFNEEGKVVRITLGYCMDRAVGNSGGLCAAFGMLYAAGRPLPFPEAQPYKPSWQLQIFNFLMNLIMNRRSK